MFQNWSVIRVCGATAIRIRVLRQDPFYGWLSFQATLCPKPLAIQERATPSYSGMATVAQKPSVLVHVKLLRDRGLSRVREGQAAVQRSKFPCLTLHS